MNRDAKVGLSLAILLMGIATALCFPREHPVELPRLEDPGSLDRQIADRPLAPYVPGDTDAPTPALGAATDRLEPALSDTSESDPYAPPASVLDTLFPPTGRGGDSAQHATAERLSTGIEEEADSHPDDVRPPATWDRGTAPGPATQHLAAAQPATTGSRRTDRAGRVEILPPPPRNARTFGAAPPSPRDITASSSETEEMRATSSPPQPYTRSAPPRPSNAPDPTATSSAEPPRALAAGAAAPARGSTLKLWPPFESGQRIDPRSAVENLPAPTTAALPPAHNTQWRILPDEAPRSGSRTAQSPATAGGARPPAESPPAAQSAPRYGAAGTAPRERPAVERLAPPAPSGPLAARPHVAAKPEAQSPQAAARPAAARQPGQADQAPAEDAFRIHVVRPGETLSEIALRYLGSVTRYREIFEANRDVLSDPDHIREGMTLRIPVGRTASEPPRVPVHRLRAAREAR